MRDRAYAVIELTVQETGVCTDGFALVYSEEGRIWREHWCDLDPDFTTFDVVHDCLEWAAATIDDYRNELRIHLPFSPA